MTPTATGGGPPAGALGSSLTAHARTGQIITFALAMGLLMMSAVLSYVTLGADNTPPVGMLPGAGGDVIIPVIGVLLTIGGCLAAAIIPPMMRRSAAAKIRGYGVPLDQPTGADGAITPQVRELLDKSQAATLVGQAQLEGSATICLVLMLLDGRLLYLGFVLVCLIGIVLLAPTTGKLQETVENAARG